MPISKKINFYILLLKNKNPGDWMKYKSSKLNKQKKPPKNYIQNPFH